jgi:hypothetical protein
MFASHSKGLTMRNSRFPLTFFGVAVSLMATAALSLFLLSYFSDR